MADPAPLVEAVEAVVLGGGPRLTPPETWTRAGVSEALSRRLWRAMGFPQVPDGEAVLTERDVEALGRAALLLSTGEFDEAAVVRQARVMSQAMATVAASHVEMLGVGSRPDALEELTRLGEGGAGVVDLLAELLGYLYRRHLVAAVQRSGYPPDAEDGPGEAVAVGFADLTGFTSAVSGADEASLADLVDQFVEAAADVVAECGGRVVKLIGDEVLFTVDSPAAAAEAALAIVDAAAARGEGLAVHAGMAAGPVLQHGGDVFGSTVNRASRLTDAARPQSVLVDEGLHDRLAGDDRFVMKRVPLRPLKGLGPVRAWVLRRHPPAVG